MDINKLAPNEITIKCSNQEFAAMASAVFNMKKLIEENSDGFGRLLDLESGQMLLSVQSTMAGFLGVDD